MAALLFILFRLNSVRRVDKCILSPTAGLQLRHRGSKAMEAHSPNYLLEEQTSTGITSAQNL